MPPLKPVRFEPFPKIIPDELSKMSKKSRKRIDLYTEMADLAVECSLDASLRGEGFTLERPGHSIALHLIRTEFDKVKFQQQHFHFAAACPVDLGKISEIKLQAFCHAEWKTFLGNWCFPMLRPLPTCAQRCCKHVVSPIAAFSWRGLNKANVMQVQVVEVFNPCSYERVQADIISIFCVDSFIDNRNCTCRCFLFRMLNQ